MPTPQRLPIVNSDDGVWGDILRQYLLKEHYDTGTDNAANGGHKTVTIQPGTASAGTAPLKFTSGTLLTTAEAGAIEFNSDKLYFTKTTGPTRQTVATYDVTGSTGDIYYRDASANFVRLAVGSTGDMLTVSSGLPAWSATVPNTATVTVKDANFTIQDDGDTTKQVKFQASGLTTATTRTLTIPDANTTIVGTDATQTLTNKTISGASNTLSNIALGSLASAAYSTTPTASTLAQWDANKNLNANAYTNGFTTTATAAGTTTLTIASTGIQVFTGSTTQTVKLPTTSVLAGAQYTIINQSSGAVTVQSSGANTISTLAANTSGIFTAIVATPTTAANWAAQVTTGASGTVTATGGSLTANSLVLGAGTTDTKVVSGIVTDGTSKITLGVAGASVGAVAFNNATSGSVTLQPVTGALGAVTLSLPAATDTLVGRATTDTLTNKTLTDPKINIIKDTNGYNGLEIQSIGSANWIAIQNKATGSSPAIISTGSDTDIDLLFIPKGTGSFKIYESAGQTTAKFEANGSATNVDLNLISKGTGVVQANGNPVIASVTGIPAVTGTPSSTTYLRGDGTWATLTGGGDMVKSTYDPANIAQQLVGTSATQTLTNKTLTDPRINRITDTNGISLWVFRQLQVR